MAHKPYCLIFNGLETCYRTRAERESAIKKKLKAKHDRALRELEETGEFYEERATWETYER